MLCRQGRQCHKISSMHVKNWQQLLILFSCQQRERHAQILLTLHSRRKGGHQRGIIYAMRSEWCAQHCKTSGQGSPFSLRIRMGTQFMFHCEILSLLPFCTACFHTRLRGSASGLPTVWNSHKALPTLLFVKGSGKEEEASWDFKRMHVGCCAFKGKRRWGYKWNQEPIEDVMAEPFFVEVVVTAEKLGINPGVFMLWFQLISLLRGQRMKVNKFDHWPSQNGMFSTSALWNVCGRSVRNSHVVLWVQCEQMARMRHALIKKQNSGAKLPPCFVLSKMATLWE